jgi:SSS family transporter
MNLSIWVASLTVAIYVFLGGLISAVFNEVLQFFLIWLGTLLVPILGMIQAGGWGKMLAMVQNNVKTIHPTFPADVDFTCLWSNLGSFDTNPMGIDWFGMVFGQGLAIGFAYWCTDFLQVQRVMVTKDLRSAQNGTIIGAVLKMCVPLIVTIPGLLGLAILTHADGSPMVLVSETDPRANITHQTYNEVLPLLMGKYLGPGLLGLGVTAMIAGFMSGMAGNVSAFATVWTYDVYRPLIYRNGTDGHYLTMGRWSSIIGVLISIGTAYLLFFFANILDFLQVLIFFFIVPLFGVVILGMLWKRATTAGGFWGFLVAILVSIFMWVYVHSFWGEGYRPQPQVLLGEKTVVRLEEGTKKGEIGRVIVEKGEIETTNVPIPLGDGPEVKTSTTLTIPNREVSLPGTLAMDPKSEPVKVRLLAPKVLLADNNRENKFGIEGVPVVLRPGVQVKVTNVAQTFTPKAFNPDHVQYIVWSPRIGWSADKGGLTFSIARSPHALPMAVNVYSAFWTLLVSLAVTIGVSLFTTPKPHVELTNLVMGLTPIPSEKGTPWHKKPLVWATVVFIVLVAVDIIFW